MTDVRLSQAQADELRAIYAAPCWQGLHWGDAASRHKLKKLGLIFDAGSLDGCRRFDWQVSETGMAWLEANP